VVELVLGVVPGETVCQELAVAEPTSVTVAAAVTAPEALAVFEAVPAAVPLLDSPGELERLPTELSVAAAELL